jgi:hypothetical protein
VGDLSTLGTHDVTCDEARRGVPTAVVRVPKRGAQIRRPGMNERAGPNSTMEWDRLAPGFLALGTKLCFICCEA